MHINFLCRPGLCYKLLLCRQEGSHCATFNVKKQTSKQTQSRSLPRGEHTGHMLCCMQCIFPSFFFFFFKFSSGVERCSTLNTSLNVTNDILYVKCCFFPPLKEKAHTEAFKNLTRQLFISISFSDIW